MAGREGMTTRKVGRKEARKLLREKQGKMREAGNGRGQEYTVHEETSGNT